MSRYEDTGLGEGPILDFKKSIKDHKLKLDNIELGEKAKAEFKQKMKELNNGIIK